jgi:hypothetical protein
LSLARVCVCGGWGFFDRHTSDLASRTLLSPVERVHEAGEDGAPGVSISLHSAVTAILDKRRGGLLRQLCCVGGVVLLSSALPRCGACLGGAPLLLVCAFVCVCACVCLCVCVFARVYAYGACACVCCRLCPGERTAIIQRLRPGSMMPPPLPNFDAEVARLTEDLSLEVCSGLVCAGVTQGCRPAPTFGDGIYSFRASMAGNRCMLGCVGATSSVT